MSGKANNGPTNALADMLANDMIDSAHLAQGLDIAKTGLADAAGLGRDELYRDRERGAKTQTRLRDLIEILNQVEPWAGSIRQAFAWYRCEPLASFGGLTAADLVIAGQAEAVKAYLRRIAVGGYA